MGEEDTDRESYYREVFAEYVMWKGMYDQIVDESEYPRFAEALRAATLQLMRRPGVREVRFEVYPRDGLVKIAAKVRRA